jgi:hypothetical protein
MHKSGRKMVEVPSFEYVRIHGESNLHTFRDGWRVLKTIFKERVKNSTEIPPKPLSPRFQVVEHATTFEHAGD